MALAAVVLLGFAGLGVDAGMWQTAKRDMQGAADQAAYSAVIAVNAGGAATVNAQAVAAQMGFVGNATNCAKNSQTGVTVCVNNPPTQGTYKGYSQGWEVFISQPQQTFLSRVFLTSVTAAAHAVALSQIKGDFCILQLNKTVGSGFAFSGTSASIDTPNCNIQVDSGSATAAKCNGSGNVITANILAVTGTTNCGSNLSPGTQLKSPVSTIANPYAQTLVPTPSCGTSGKGSGYDQLVAQGLKGDSINGTVTLTPPTTSSPPELVWCDSQGLDFSGTANVTLNPGIYIITQGVLKINAGATLTGTGVTFVLEGTASLDIAGGASVNLSAPLLDSGSSMAGLVFFQPSSNTSGATINGGGVVSFTGALDFAAAAVTYGGGTGAASPCTQLIGDTITISGNTTFQNNCTGIANNITGSPTTLAE
jgi:hypothetical protein